MKVVAFDLETIADKRMIANLPEPKADSRIKDPVKIAANIEEKRKKQIADMGLSPMYNMICCAGWADGEKSGTITLEEESPEAEKKLLEEFWEILNNYDHFVTFNGRSFDVRCLLLHGMEYGIYPAVNIDRGKYNKAGSNHTDLRLVLSGDDPFAKGQLDTYAKKYLGDQKTEGIDGAMVQDYWEMGLKEDIANYCEKDCQLTMGLYQMADKAGLLE